MYIFSVLQASCKTIGSVSLCTRVKHAICADYHRCICGPGFETKNRIGCEQGKVHIYLILID